MKRYTPSEEERARISALERTLGISGSGGSGGTVDTGGAANTGAAATGPAATGAHRTVTRMSLAAWRDLWKSDPGEWFRELRDRPRRFDPSGWRRGVVVWHNETPPTPRDSEITPLGGVPFLVKDLFDLRGERTTAGSRVLSDGSGPGGGASVAPRDSWLPAVMRSRGAHPVGRTTMNEFAYGLDGRNSHTGNCPHPLDRERISGGSSSGSAWAVAAGVVPLALGTDTGGSIRVPAALCGIYGFRMAWDATRLTGVFPLSRRMDTVGWFVADPGDAVELLRLETGLSGSGDGAGSSRTERGAERALRVGALIPPSVILDDPVAEVWSRTLRTLATGGTDRCVMKDLPSPDVFGTETWKAYNVIGSVDAWDVHAEWLDTYRDLYDPVVWALIDRGRHWSPERLAEAERHREEVARAFGRLFEEVDVLVMPVTPVASPRQREADGDFRERTLRLNAPVSLAGLPALSVPLRHNAVESSGMQVVTPAGKESRLLRFLEVWREVATGEER